MKLCYSILKKLNPRKYGYSIKSLSIVKQNLIITPLIMHFVQSNNPESLMLDTRSFEIIEEKKYEMKSIKNLIIEATYQEFPDDLKIKYKSMIKDEKICEIEIIDSDINSEDLYKVLLNILR